LKADGLQDPGLDLVAPSARKSELGRLRHLSQLDSFVIEMCQPLKVGAVGLRAPDFRWRCQ
jgi:hypothetical protein